MGNHLADKVAVGNSQCVTSKLPQVQWKVVNFIMAIASLPEEGELNIADYRGHPKALYGIMDAVHTVLHERYAMNQDNTSVAGYYWQDNFISPAASVFNDHLKSIGYYAHTSRMVYDKH